MALPEGDGVVLAVEASSLALGRPTLDSSALILSAVIMVVCQYSGDIAPVTATLLSTRMMAALLAVVSVIWSMVTSVLFTPATVASACLNLAC